MLDDVKPTWELTLCNLSLVRSYFVFWLIIDIGF
jgi:hypothetical protein